MGQRIVRTKLQSIVLHDPQVWHPVSRRKQLQAFPPNFIHSLDATHMLLSALKCQELSMTFASIHDSFWTHARDVDRMSRVLRDSFVEMHKDNIVGRLREEFQTRYKGCMYLASVVSTSPVGLKISEQRKQRKQRKKHGAERNELAIEMERLRLLASDDPQERAKGESIVTPGSILASEIDETAIAIPTEIVGQQLGEIPENADIEDGNSDLDEPALPDVIALAEGVEITNSDSDDSALSDNISDGENAATVDAASKAAGESENTQKPRNSGIRKTRHRKLHVWMPLTFPEIPPKGEFDVRKIRKSDYFFH